MDDGLTAERHRATDLVGVGDLVPGFEARMRVVGMVTHAGGRIGSGVERGKAQGCGRPATTEAAPPTRAKRARYCAPTSDHTIRRLYS